MKAKEEKSTGLVKKYSITIDSADFAAAVDKKLTQVVQNIKMPGFRAGHAPKAMIEQKYRPSVLGEVLDDMVRNAVNQVIIENKLRPAATPDIKIEKFEDGKDIEFTMETEVIPEIKLGDFSKISLKKYTAKVPAEEIEKAVKYMAESRRNTAKVEKDRAAQKGDIVIIDFVGSIDGVEFNGGKGSNYPLELGSNSFIPGYEDQLIGHKAGETVNVKTTFPAEYHAKELAGKEALFVTTIKELREYVPTEINDEFAKAVGAKDLADLKAQVESHIANNYSTTSHIKLKRDLLDVLDKEYKFEIPQKLVDAEYQMIEKQYQAAKANNRLDEADKNRDEKDILAEYKDIALRRVKLGLLLSEVGNINKITLSADDINKAIINEAKKYPGQEKQVFDYYNRNKDAIEALRAPAYEDKIIDFILEQAKLTDTEISVAELYDFDQSNTASEIKSAAKTAKSESKSAKSESKSAKSEAKTTAAKATTKKATAKKTTKKSAA
ncbi:MAG: trigger factor [Alphaproteobacteria bacterium]|nr:trigger factor [Alphaproteobacteria bacterium]